MLDREIVKHCAPTLAGMKTGSLFSLREDAKLVNREVRLLNQMTVKKGLRALTVSREENLTLVYLYRPDHLKRDLEKPEAVKLLKARGYPCQDANQCIVQLMRNLKSEPDFPHEIGLFLGYPPEDVRGFMNDPCRGVKCVGCWKVYGNLEKAEKTFARYKKCTTVYRRELSKGRPLERLVVESRAGA